MPGAVSFGGPSGSTIRVQGLRELNLAFSKMEKHVGGELKGELKRVAEPVQLRAQQLAVTKISGLKRTNAVSGAEWALMRIGATRTVVYVAPEQRGRMARRNPRRYRRGPQFAGLLMEKAMEPALEQNEGRTVAAVEEMLDRLADRNGF